MIYLLKSCVRTRVSLFWIWKKLFNWANIKLFQMLFSLFKTYKTDLYTVEIIQSLWCGTLGWWSLWFPDLVYFGFCVYLRPLDGQTHLNQWFQFLSFWFSLIRLVWYHTEYTHRVIFLLVLFKMWDVFFCVFTEDVLGWLTVYLNCFNYCINKQCYLQITAMCFAFSSSVFVLLRHVMKTVYVAGF